MGREAKLNSIKKKIDDKLEDFAKVTREIAHKSRQIPRDVIVKDMGSFLAQMPLTDDDIQFLYHVLKNRIPHRVCVRCGKSFAMGVEGDVYTWGHAPTALDKGCAEFLIEKGQVERPVGLDETRKNA